MGVLPGHYGPHRARPVDVSWDRISAVWSLATRLTGLITVTSQTGQLLTGLADLSVGFVNLLFVL